MLTIAYEIPTTVLLVNEYKPLFLMPLINITVLLKTLSKPLSDLNQRPADSNVPKEIKFLFN